MSVQASISCFVPIYAQRTVVGSKMITAEVIAEAEAETEEAKEESEALVNKGEAAAVNEEVRKSTKK